jgi:hypothetical protein
MFLEATNQAGADPYFVEVHIPWWKARFAITDDSEGWRAVKKILNAAFPGELDDSIDEAMSYLDVHLPGMKQDGDNPPNTA